MPAPRRLLIGGATAVVVVVVFIGLLPDSGSAPTDAPRTELDIRQAQYNAFIQQARRDVARDPTLNCDLDFQDLVVDQVEDATGSEKTLIRLAMGDACIEAGEYSNAAQYSPYHSKAPP